MKFLILLIVLCFLPMTLFASEQDWLFRWPVGGDAPHKESTFWTVQGTGRQRMEDEALRISTEGEEKMLFFTTQEASHGIWNAEKPIVVEVEARALSSDGPEEGAAFFAVSDGRKRALVRILTPEFALYRLEFKNGSAQLLVDGEERPEMLTMLSVPVTDSIANGFYFGDDSRKLSGTSLFRAIRWAPLDQ